MENIDNLYVLRDMCQKTDDVKEKMALLERAITIAENKKEFNQAYQFRSELIDLCTHDGYPLKALVAFSQNLKYADENPKEVQFWNLLWEYKWMISIVVKFHQVSYDKIFSMLEDFKKRLLEYGDNLSAYYTMSFWAAKIMRNTQDLEKYHELRKSTPQGSLNHCSTCVLDDQVSFIAYQKGFEAAEKKAKPILDGEMTCGSVPQYTYLTLIQHALKEGKIEKAVHYCKKGLPYLLKSDKFFGHFGYHMITHIINDNVAEALTLFKKHYHKTLNEANTGFNYYEFHLGAYLLFDHLEKHENNIELRLPFAIEGLCEKEALVSSKALRDFMKDKLEEIAKLFDARNRNNAFMDEIDVYRKLINQ